MTTFTSEDLESLKTEWFPADVKPVHEGWYEVILNKWPWPERVEWLEGAWFVDKGVKVEKWRGLKERNYSYDGFLHTVHKLENKLFIQCDNERHISVRNIAVPRKYGYKEWM